MSGTDDIQMAMAARLKEARMRKFSIAAAAARALGINDVTLRAHESGQNGIPADMVVKYCRAFGMDPNWLIRGHRPTDLQADRFNGVKLRVSGEVARGVYRDSSVPPSPPLGDMTFPRGSSFFGIEVFEVTSDAWEPEIPLGAFLICTPADSITLRTGDRVVVERDRGGLVETSLKVLSQVKDVVYLRDTNYVPENFIPLTGEGAATDYRIKSVVQEFVLRFERPPLDASIDAALPLVKRPAESL